MYSILTFVEKKMRYNLRKEERITTYLLFNM